MPEDRPRISPSFGALLDQMSLADLERNPSVIFGLWPDLTLAYVNPAWYRFARENGGEPEISRAWDLGRNVMDAVTPLLQPFYREFFGRQLDPAAPCQLSQHEYECSTAEVYRRHVMTVYRLGDAAGLLVTNVPVVERLQDRPGRAPYTDDYHDSAGWVRQCAHCRCVQHRLVPDRWDWVPFWVASPPAFTTHGLCPLCLDHFYPA